MKAIAVYHAGKFNVHRTAEFSPRLGANARLWQGRSNVVRQRRNESVSYWQSSQKSGVFTVQCKVHQARPSLESIEPSSVPVSNCQCRGGLFASSTSTNHLNPSSKTGFLLPTFSTKKDESQPYHTLPLVPPEGAYWFRKKVITRGRGGVCIFRQVEAMERVGHDKRLLTLFAAQKPRSRWRGVFWPAHMPAAPY